MDEINKINDEVLLCNYTLALRDMERAIDNFSDDDTMTALLNNVEAYKQEILRRMKNGTKEPQNNEQ